MRCFICDRAIDEPQYNSDHEDWDPCETCKAVISEAVGVHDDRSYVAEDEFGGDVELEDDFWAAELPFAENDND